MTSFAAIRAGLVDALEPLSNPGVLIGGQRQPVFVSPYILDDPTPPVVMIEGVDRITYKAGAPLVVNVIAHVGATTEQGAQAILDELLMSATTVESLIETERTLGGLVGDVWVDEASGHKVFTLGARKVLGAIWVVHMTLLD